MERVTIGEANAKSRPPRTGEPWRHHPEREAPEPEEKLEREELREDELREDELPKDEPELLAKDEARRVAAARRRLSSSRSCS